MTQGIDVPEFRDALAALRAITAEWPGVSETLSWGNPTFKANGKSFAVLDRYEGGYCVWLRCATERRQQLLGQDGYFAAPYDRRQSAICRRLDQLDWNDFETVLRESYENVMPG
jgi:hypothetical protein